MLRIARSAEPQSLFKASACSWAFRKPTGIAQFRRADWRKDMLIHDITVF